MALIICPECSRDVSDKAAACPHCGFPINREFETRQQEYSVPQEQPIWPKHATQSVATTTITHKAQPAPFTAILQ